MTLDQIYHKPNCHNSTYAKIYVIIQLFMPTFYRKIWGVKKIGVNEKIHSYLRLSTANELLKIDR